MNDEQLRKVIDRFYGYPNGFTTEDFYDEYLEACIEDDVKPRPKSIIIREVCNMTGLKIREVKTHYFYKE